MKAISQLQTLLTDDKPSIVAFDSNKSIYLQQLQHDLLQCVASLKSNPSNTYLLFIDNSYHFTVNLLSLLLLNKNVVLSANNKPDWLDSIASAYGAIISDAPLHQSYLSATHYEDIQTELDNSALTVPPNFDSEIQFYTSGSSSRPKAISKTISQLLIEVDTLEELFQEQLGTCHVLATVSHHHIYGLIFRLLWPLLYRRPFFIDIILYPEQLIELNRLYPQSCLVSSPAFLSRQDHKLTKVSLAACFSSGSLLIKSAAEAAHKQLGVFPIEVFGSTETGGIGYRTQHNHNILWTLFPGLSLTTDDHQKATLESPYLIAPQRLDDRVKLLPNGQFELLGRADRVVKIEEKRVSLDAVEATLCESPFVEEAKLVVLQQNRRFLGAVIKLSPKGLTHLQQHSKLELNKLLKHSLIQRFDAVAIPRKWRYLEQLPYNAQGKLPVNTLTELF